ncbi:MAG: universal stress protein [Spirochaetes bacterium]|nr:universal stress protein [Spirochaetota bacterium]
MYKILITTDGAGSKKTIEETMKIAVPMGKEVEVSILFVMEKIDNMIYAPDIDGKLKKAITTTQDEAAAEAVKSVQEQFAAKGVKATSKVLKGNPVDQICAYAEKEKANLIIMGKKARGKLEEFFVGSVSAQVVQRAKTNVLVIK